MSPETPSTPRREGRGNGHLAGAAERGRPPAPPGAAGEPGSTAPEMPPEKMWLSDLSIRQPHLITMLVVAVMVVGSLAYSRMGLDLFPDVSIPVVAVRTVYPGVSPSEVERAVTRPIEDAVLSLNGVDTVTSTSADSLSSVIVQFKLDKDAKVAADEVRARVDLVRNQFPTDTQDPVVQRFDPAAAPILSLAVSDSSGKRSPEQLRSLMDDALKPRLERIAGVASVAVTGGLVREIHVDLKRDRMEALGVAAQQVGQAIRGDNLDVPGGRVTRGSREQSVKTAGEITSLEQMGEVSVPSTRGTSVSLKDVADVSAGYAEVRAYRRLNGTDAVVATIQKQSGTNSVSVADEIKAEIKRIEADYANLRATVTADQSEFTRESVVDVQLSMVLGAFLTALVVFAFFRDWRNTLVTVAGLPVIVLGTFAVMSVLGMSLNMITLMALSLSVGILIDDAIVVRENIFRRMEAGEEPWVAAQRGTAEIALAVVAVSSTIIAVFLPIAFTSGITGKFLRDFGLTIAIAVLFSLVEAFTLAPMLSAHFFKRMVPSADGDRKVGRVERAFSRLDGAYRRLLEWALGRRLLVMGVGAALFVGSLAVVPFMTFAFTPETDQGMFTVSVELPVGSTLDETDRVARRVDSVLRQQPIVEDVFMMVGSDAGSVEKATLTAKLKAKAPGLTQGTIARLRPELEQVAAPAKLTAAPAASAVGGGGGAAAGTVNSRPVLYVVQGPAGADLDGVSRTVMEALAAIPGTVDVERSLQAGKPSTEVVVDRARAADLGISTVQVGNTVRALVNGDRAGSFRQGDKQIDVIVRLQASDRATADDLLRLPIATSRGTLVPLSAAANTAPTLESTLIERRDRQRMILVGAGVLGRTQGAVATDAARAVAQLQLPAGVTVKPSGQAAQTQDAFSALGMAMALSVLFVYMILCAQFASFVHPFTIMLALPFSIVGALLGLLLTGKGLDMLAMIGIILLMGLVTKNSILVVDFTNQLRRRGYATRDALLEAGPVRLRPILMTTLAMIFGMLPLALGVGAGSELRQSMGIGVIGGLLTSTLLTLVAVPVAYSLVESGRARIEQWRERGRGSDGGEVPVTLEPGVQHAGVPSSKSPPPVTRSPVPAGTSRPSLPSEVAGR